MADNVNLPLTGSGDATAIVATDDVASVHYQVVKLADGTLGGTGLIAGDATNGLDVDVTRVIPGTAATALGKAEDAAHTTGDVGVMLLAKRTDTAPAATSGTDGDYEPLQVAGGRLWASATIDAALPAGTNAIGKLAANSGVDIGDVDVTTVGTITPGTAATSLGKAEDAAHVSGDVGVMLLAKRTDTAPAATSGTDGDYEPLQVAGGRLWASVVVDTALPAGTAAIGKLAANSGVDIGDVDVTTVGTITPGTAASSLGKAEDAAHTTGDVGVMLLGVRNDAGAALAGTTGDYIPLAMDASGGLQVGGHVAHDAVDAGAPVKIGGKSRQTNPTAVADADRVDGMYDDVGRQVVVVGHVRDLVVHQHTQIASSSAETTILTAGAAGVFHDLVSLIITNQTATACNVTIKDATAGTTRMIIALAAAAGGGMAQAFTVPIPQAATAQNWTATLSSAAVTVNIYVQAVKNV